MLKLYCTLLFFLLAVAPETLAQRDIIRFKQVSVNEGLSSGFVNCFLQDNKGFMWIGTRDGLNRFDGNEFKIFRFDPDDEGSISDNSIESLFQDKSGRIWVGTHNGINIFDNQSNSFTRLMHNPENINSLCHQEVRDVVQINDTTYWIASYGGGIDKLVVHSGLRPTYSFTHYNESSNNNFFIPTNYVNDLFIDSDGTLWAGLQRDGLFMYSPEENRFFTPDYINLFKTREIRATVNMITEDSDKHLWIGTWEMGFFKIDKKNKQLTNYNFDINNENLHYNYVARCLVHDNFNHIWLGSFGDGLVKFNKENGQITKYHNDPLNSTSLGSNIVWNLYIDNSNTLWAGTWGAGVNLYELGKTNFVQYTHQQNNTNSLSGNQVNHIANGTNGEIWISTFDAGISVFNYKTETFAHIKNKPGNYNSLESNTVWCTYVDNDENGEVVWIGTQTNFSKYNVKTNSFNHFKYEEINPDNPKAPGFTNIRYIFEDSYDTIWLATYGGGVDKFDKKNEIFTHYRNNPDDSNSISGNAIFTIFEDSRKNLWFGTANSGLDRFDRAKQQFVNYQFDSHDKNSLSSNNVLCIFEDSKRRLWIGTSNGLNLFRPETGTFRHITMKDGLPNNNINSIQEDSLNYLWISTNYGITRYMPENGEIINYSKFDGLDNTFLLNVSTKTPDGYMFFGGSNGLNMFHPGSITESSFTAPVVITDFKLFNKTVQINKEYNGRVLLTKPIEETDKIIISHKHKEIGFDFASLHFPSPEKNLYKYKLEGFNDEWVNTNSSRRFAIFSNLPPGKYTFRVMGTNNDGIWNPREAAVELLVLPPFWKTWAFRLLIIVIVTIILAGIFIYRNRAIIAKNKYLSKVVEERTYELQIQAEELNEINTLLEERQQQIEENTEELMVQKEELEKSNSLLQEVNATKDKFFSIIAHDVKNPFSNILGFAELLKIKYDTLNDEKKKQMIGILYQSAENVYGLLENLLQWSRSQRGVIEYRPVKAPFKNILGNVISVIGENAIQKSIRITTRIESADMEIYADPQMLDVIVRNLVNNAIKFTGENGEIIITALTAGSNVKISVADNGVGMSEENVKKLFRIDTSFSTSGTNQEKGSGLGLILVNEFVTRHSGKIEVASTPGKGSTFTVFLPVNEGNS
ncbi:MAG: hypothetical protein JXB34_09490 [Bacteroidales bacterium]|nr:hypothetical protein [Bacteroidales bacterium]